MNGKQLPKKIKKPTLSQLRRKLDKVFSEFIRQRDKGICCTCGKQDTWKYMQCGHYISRSSLATRYNEINCHCQCVGCNIFKKGNMPSYTLFLQKKYGYEIIQSLYKKSLEITKDFPYLSLIALYEGKLNSRQ